MFTTHEHNLSIGGKLVSYTMLYGMINRRFHDCMSQEKKDPMRMAQIVKMDDRELVHQVCRRERLTLFNFLKAHLVDYKRSAVSTDLGDDGEEVFKTSLNEERLKDLIHSEYLFYFRSNRMDKGAKTLNIYREANQLLRKPDSYNDLAPKLKVNYE